MCRVVLLETSKYWMVASRFSNCVDRFATVPVPEKDPDAFLEAVRALAVEEKADLFVPVTSPVASQYEAHVASVLPAGCRSWSLDPAAPDFLRLFGPTKPIPGAHPRRPHRSRG